MNKFKTIIASCLIALSVGSISTAIVQSVNTHEADAASAHNLDTLYAACEEAVSNKSASDLWSAVKTASKDGYSEGSYSGLWTWYWTTDVRSDGKMNDYYSNITNYTSSGKCGTYSVEGDCYNREHTIPQSWWGGGTDDQGCDIFIVLPTDGKVNGVRSNHPLGETNGSSDDSANHYSKLGSSTFSGYSGTVFEVNDEWKGDFARIYFYALTAWPSVNFGQASEATSTFVNSASKTASNNYGLTTYGLNLLLKWHRNDPVSPWEEQRNSRAESVQGNRNPYIDKPQYVEYLWGTGFPGDSSDPVAVSSVTLNKNSLSLNVNGTETLTATVLPSNATDKTVTWTSSNPSVATVSSSGLVKGIAAGSATITVESNSDNTKSATCTVTVSDSGGGGGSSTVTDTITAADLAATSTTYTDFSGVTKNTAVYAGQSAKDGSGNIQIRSKNSNSGIITTTSGGTVSSVKITVGSGSNTINLYGKSSAYTSVTELFDSSKQGTLVDTLTATGTVNYNDSYEYVGIRSASGAIYISEIEITWTTSGGGSETVAVTGISLDKEAASLTVGGDDTTISATVTPSDATNKTVNWSSNNTSVATVSSPTSQSGALITIHAVAAGNATITASSDYDSSISKTCTVTVTAPTPAVTSVTLNKSTLSLAAGKSETLTATVVTVGGAAQTVTWTSSNENVATVTSSGVVTVKSTATVGQTATITATSTVDTTKKGDCTLTVKSSVTPTTETYSIIFTKADSDSSTSLTDANFLTANTVYTTNTLLDSVSGVSKAYVGVNGLKFGTSSAIGTFTGTPVSSARTNVSKVVITSTKYGSDSGKLKFSVGSTAITSNITPGNTYTYEPDSPIAISTFKLETTSKRAYVGSIEFTITNTPDTPTLTSISLSGYKETFTVGDEFSYGGTVTANYSDGSHADVTQSASFSGYDMNSTGNQTVTVSYGDQSETYGITVNGVTPTENNTYKLVSDVTKLRAGDKVIIVNTDGDYALSTTQNTNNRKATSVTKNNDNTISITSAVQSLELKDGTTSGTFSFYTGSGYLYAAGSGSGSNFLRTEETLSDNSSFEITIENSVATVIAQGTYTNNTMRYNANSGNPIFSCYASSTNSVSIYKKLYTAVEYSKVFLEEVGCDASGATAPSQDNWSLLKYRYTNELSSDAKTTLSNATAHEYKNPSTDEQYLAQAMYQYDYIMVKYNKTSDVYEKFITGRASNGLIFNGNIYASNMNDNIVPILVIIGILSLTGAGIILFVRKRKEI